MKFFASAAGICLFLVSACSSTSDTSDGNQASADLTSVAALYDQSKESCKDVEDESSDFIKEGCAGNRGNLNCQVGADEVNIVACKYRCVIRNGDDADGYKGFWWASQGRCIPNAKYDPTLAALHPRPMKNPCDTTSCGSGSQCVIKDGAGRCYPDSPGRGESCGRYYSSSCAYGLDCMGPVGDDGPQYDQATCRSRSGMDRGQSCGGINSVRCTRGLACIGLDPNQPAKMGVCTDIPY